MQGKHNPYHPVCLQLLLMGKRGGGFTHWRTNRAEPQEFQSTRAKHSEKPEEIRDLLRDYFAVGSRIELFAREPQGRAPPDWDCWVSHMSIRLGIVGFGCSVCMLIILTSKSCFTELLEYSH